MSLAILSTVPAMKLAHDNKLSDDFVYSFAESVIANRGEAYWWHFHAYLSDGGERIIIETMSEYEQRQVNAKQNSKIIEEEME